MTEMLLASLAEQAGLAAPSIVVRSLTGARAIAAALAPSLALYPASMIKVPLAAALWATELEPDARVTVSDANMTVNDAPSPLTPGYSATLEELASLMLRQSDNVATNVLIDVVGRGRATRIVQAMGLEATAIRRKLSGDLPLIVDPEATGRNAHPAGDAARLFAAIAAKTAPRSEWLLETLLHQEWNEKLPRGLRDSDRFAHKTGDTDEVTHDGGILFTAEGAQYVIVVYTGMPSSPENSARLTDFMTRLRPLL